MIGSNVKVVIKEDLYDGYQLGEDEDGNRFLVRYGIVGEMVIAHVYARDGEYYKADVIDVELPSSDRIKPRCKYFGLCGGCDFQMLPYSKQLDIKRSILKKAFIEYAGIDISPDILPSPKQFNYRNTATFKVKPKQRKIGFFRKGSKYIIDIDYCYLMMDGINKALRDIRKQDAFPPHNFKVRQTSDGDVVVHWIDAMGYEDRDVVDKVRLYDRVWQFKISPESFYQVNGYVIPIWLNEIIDMVKEVSPNRVYDLFCGIGIIGIAVSDYCNEVIGIEVSKSAINNAVENARLNNVGNIRFRQIDIHNDIIELDSGMAIIDPPRKGMGEKNIKTLIDSNIDHIIYSSCEEITLAKDIKQLIEGGFKLIDIKAIDMFANTNHLESICLLTR